MITFKALGFKRDPHPREVLATVEAAAAATGYKRLEAALGENGKYTEWESAGRLTTWVDPKKKKREKRHE